VTIVDALRPGHEVAYHPGETNLRAADVVIVNKADGATPATLAAIAARVAEVNPRAVVVSSRLAVDADAAAIAGRRALVIEDGPTVTHGGMPDGAGLVAARAAGAAELVDARPFAVGSIAAAFARYPHLGRVLPALGYSAEQRAELAATIRAARPDVVVDASPARIGRVLGLDLPVVEVGYRFVQLDGPDLLELIAARLS
jgi:predicted GTPase